MIKKKKNRLRSVVLVICLWALLSAPGHGADLILFQPDNFPVSKLALTSVKVRLRGITLEAVFRPDVSYPHIRFDAARIGFPSDWSAYLYLGVTVENPGAELSPGEKKRLVLPLGATPIVGMRGQPPATGLQPNDIRLVPSSTVLNLQRISRFQIFMARPPEERAIVIYRIELFGDARNGPGAFVDRFGQYNGADWPGQLVGLHGNRRSPGRRLHDPGVG